MTGASLRDLLYTLDQARSRFSHGLDLTPDDRLAWSPGGAAHTPLALAGRLARFISVLAQMLGERAVPEDAGAPPPLPPTRDEAKELAAAAFARLRAVVAGLTPEDLEATIALPWNPQERLSRVLWYAPVTLGYFQGQLNYLQLAAGDTDPNMPPDWGRETA